MITISEFEALYPRYAFNFGAELQLQQRILDGAELLALPTELAPIGRRTSGSRGRPNRNQTKTHFQCSICERVLRNDFYRQRDRNNVNSYCDECDRAKASRRTAAKAETRKDRRIVIWRYIAPKCAVCGFDKSTSALDMHHVNGKDFQIASLATWVCGSNQVLLHNVERLCAEASRCIPLCSNCHRMVHAGEITLPSMEPLHYDALELLGLLRDYEQSFQYHLLEAA
jgi:hypothetical protein